MPIVIIAGAVGLVDLWRRLDGKSRRLRRVVVVATLALALLGVLVNLAISLPAEKLAWGDAPSLARENARSYVKSQESVGELTGYSIMNNVVFGNDLPAHGPADQIYVLGICDGLYISTGESDRPWVPVELRSVDLDFTINGPLRNLPRTRLLTVGTGPYSVLSMEGSRDGRVRFRISDRLVGNIGKWQHLERGRRYHLDVAADTGRHEAYVQLDGREVLNGFIIAPGHTKVVNERGAVKGGPLPPVTVSNGRIADAPMCERFAIAAHHTPASAGNQAGSSSKRN
jgi:hypothetical protein